MALGNARSEDRWAAAEALGWIGPDAAGAIAALRSALTDQDLVVRAAAAKALERIRGEEAGKK